MIERAVGAVTPAVIRAFDGGALTARLSQQLGCPVPAHVVEAVERSVFRAPHEEREFRRSGRDVLSRLGHFTLAPNPKPLARKDASSFDLIDIGIGVPPRRKRPHGGRFHPLLDSTVEVVGRSSRRRHGAPSPFNRNGRRHASIRSTALPSASKQAAVKVPPKPAPPSTVATYSSRLTPPCDGSKPRMIFLYSA